MNLFIVAWSDPGAVVDRGRHATSMRHSAEGALRSLADRLPFFDAARIETWASGDGSAAAACVSHPPEQTGGVSYRLFEPDRMVMWSGRPFVWSNEGADGRAPLDPAFYLADGWADSLDGRCAVARFADGELTIRADPLGAYPLYTAGADGTRWVSNNAVLLRSITGGSELDPAVLASVLAGGWSLSGDPLWTGIRRLAPGVHEWTQGRPPKHRDLLSLDEIATLPGAGFDRDRASSTLIAAVGALSDWPGRPSIVPLTGGRDSRVVFAAALKAEIDFETRTGGEPGHPDVEVARELAGIAGHEHRLLEHDPHGSVHSHWRKAAEIVGLTSSGTATLADAAGYPLGPRAGPLVLWHSGQGGEIARAYYGLGEGLDRNGLADRLYARFAGRRPGRAEPLSGDGVRLVQRQIRAWVDEQLDAGVGPVDVPDMFYLQKRMGTWAGPGHGCVEYVRDTTSPLWTPRLLPDLLGLPARERAQELFHRRVLERLAPELADIPFESGAGWTSGHSRARRELERARELAGKSAAELVRRTRGASRRAADLVRRGRGPADQPARPSADLFAPVLADIREVVLSADSHPAWPLLDRSRVERLLSREAVSLDTMSRYYVWRLATVFAMTLDSWRAR